MSVCQITEAVGKRIFVVGDLHGCFEEPEVLLYHLETVEALSQEDIVIFLGDYIDRGPNSKLVVELLVRFRSRFPRTRFLRGNHEDMLLDFLGFGGNLGQAFLQNGGLETIQNYGISVFAPPNEIVDALPEDHFRFFTELESMILIDNYICVHAGLNPKVELTAQVGNDAFWIRDEFLHNTHDFMKTVVFGHTPHQEVFQHMPFKLGLDTGLVFNNKLTCMELRSGTVYSVKRGSSTLEVSKIDVNKRAFAQPAAS